MILTKMKETAEAFLGETVKNAVIKILPRIRLNVIPFMPTSACLFFNVQFYSRIGPLIEMKSIITLYSVHNSWA